MTRIYALAASTQYSSPTLIALDWLYKAEPVFKLVS